MAWWVNSVSWAHRRPEWGGGSGAPRGAAPQGRAHKALVSPRRSEGTSGVPWVLLRRPLRNRASGHLHPVGRLPTVWVGLGRSQGCWFRARSPGSPAVVLGGGVPRRHGDRGAVTASPQSPAPSTGNNGKRGDCSAGSQPGMETGQHVARLVVFFRGSGTVLGHRDRSDTGPLSMALWPSRLSHPQDPAALPAHSEGTATSA